MNTPTQPTQPQFYVLSAEWRNGLIAYLMTKPFAEVEAAIGALRALQPIQPQPLVSDGTPAATGSANYLEKLEKSAA